MNIRDLIITGKEQISLDDIFMEEANRRQLNDLLKEYEYIAEISKYNLPINNKILLHGATGCGKTTTAKALASTLKRPIYILNLSNIISAKIGETSQQLKQVFDKAANEKAVLFLDEFDQVGKARNSADKDVGEMRRLVNTLIQLIDYYPDDAILICATNQAEVVDTALLRRFQLNIEYTMPTQKALDRYYDSLLQNLPSHIRNIERKYNVSYAEAKDSAYTQAKSLLIDYMEKEKLVENL